jgi:imidazolonepropionase-like amidohydrolase
MDKHEFGRGVGACGLPHRLFTLMFSSVAALFLSVAGAAAQTQLLSGATLIDGQGGAIENGEILIEGDRITCMGALGDCPVPDGVTRHELIDHFITPGLVDAHVHFMQTGWLDGRPDGLNAPDVYPYAETVAELRADPGRWHRAYLCSGITAVYDVGGADWTVTDPHATDTDRPDRVHVKTAGPLQTYASARNRFFVVGPEEGDLFLPFDTDAQAEAGVAHVQNIGGQAIKIWFLHPPAARKAELDSRLLYVGELARKAGLPLIVHATELEQAKTALKAGASMLVHSVEDVAVDQEFLDLLQRNDAVYAPTLVVGQGWTRALASVVFAKPVSVDDPNNCVDEAILDRINHPDRMADALGGRMSVTQAMAQLQHVGRTAGIMAQNLRTVRDAGGRIVVATDAGNPLTVHGPSIYWEMEAMQAAGMRPDEIIEAATLAGAKAMDIDDQTGTLAPGKLADLIVMANDPREDVTNFRSLTHVMRKGVLKRQAELQVR